MTKITEMDWLFIVQNGIENPNSHVDCKNKYGANVIKNQKVRNFKRNITKESFFSYIFHVVRKR